MHKDRSKKLYTEKPTTSYETRVLFRRFERYYSWENIVRTSGLWSVVQSASATGWDVFHCIHARTVHTRVEQTWKSTVIRALARARERDAASPVVIPFTDWNLRPFVTVKEVAIASLLSRFLSPLPARVHVGPGPLLFQRERGDP